MSRECSECERDLRRGHDPQCSRYRATYQVPVTYEARGYVTVTARNSLDARRRVMANSVYMDYGSCEGDFSMMPESPDLTIIGVPVQVENEDE